MLSTALITLNPVSSPETCLAKIAQLKGKIDIYSWFEGPQGMPVKGAAFLKEKLYQPLYGINPEATLYLYSLKDWDFHNPKEANSLLSDTINRMNQTAVRSLTASSFFNYADESDAVQTSLGNGIASKKWLVDLSESHKARGIKAGEVFKGSLFTLISEWDLARCYSFLAVRKS